MNVYSMKFSKKKAKIKIKFQKMKSTFLGQHPLVEKSPAATGVYASLQPSEIKTYKN